MFIRDRQEEPLARYNDRMGRSPIHITAVAMRRQYWTAVAAARDACPPSAAQSDAPETGRSLELADRAARDLQMISLRSLDSVVGGRDSPLAAKWRAPLRQAIAHMATA